MLERRAGLAVYVALKFVIIVFHWINRRSAAHVISNLHHLRNSIVRGKATVILIFNQLLYLLVISSILVWLLGSTNYPSALFLLQIWWLLLLGKDLGVHSLCHTPSSVISFAKHSELLIAGWKGIGIQNWRPGWRSYVCAQALVTSNHTVESSSSLVEFLLIIEAVLINLKKLLKNLITPDKWNSAQVKNETLELTPQFLKVKVCRGILKPLIQNVRQRIGGELGIELVKELSKLCERPYDPPAATIFVYIQLIDVVFSFFGGVQDLHI